MAGTSAGAKKGWLSRPRYTHSGHDNRFSPRTGLPSRVVASHSHSIKTAARYLRKASGSYARGLKAEVKALGWRGVLAKAHKVFSTIESSGGGRRGGGVGGGGRFGGGGASSRW